MTMATQSVAQRTGTRRWPRAQRFFRHRLAVFGAATIAVMTIACIVPRHTIRPPTRWNIGPLSAP